MFYRCIFIYCLVTFPAEVESVSGNLSYHTKHTHFFTAKLLSTSPNSWPFIILPPQLAVPGALQNECLSGEAIYRHFVRGMTWNVSSVWRREEWWKAEKNRGGWATWTVIAFFLSLYALRFLVRIIKRLYSTWLGQSPATGFISRRNTSNLQKVGSSVTEADLRKLLEELEGKSKDGTPWVHVLDKRNAHMAYCVKRRDPPDGGPTQYLSTTVFENCSTELLRNFYMDDTFRMKWDSTVVKHQQLEICKKTGVEVGCTIKKFPLLSPREYVLAWRIWEGKDNSFFCIVKGFEHVMAPRQPKYKRVECYRSGWWIRKVPGRSACEIKMWHQEDGGMNREMAKMAFSRGIWSYMCKMETNLRKYALADHKTAKDANAVTLAHKVPPWVTEVFGGNAGGIKELDNTGRTGRRFLGKVKVPAGRQSVKLFAKGMLLLGGAIFCARGSAPLGARLAALCALRRMIRPQATVNEASHRRVRSESL